MAEVLMAIQEEGDPLAGMTNIIQMVMEVKVGHLMEEATMETREEVEVLSGVTTNITQMEMADKGDHLMEGVTMETREVVHLAEMIDIHIIQMEMVGKEDPLVATTNTIPTATVDKEGLSMEVEIMVTREEVVGLLEAMIVINREEMVDKEAHLMVEVMIVTLAVAEEDISVQVPI